MVSNLVFYAQSTITVISGGGGGGGGGGDHSHWMPGYHKLTHSHWLPHT